jgi:hypothetical protein
LNTEVYEALVAHQAWYLKRFGEIRNEWYVFPWGKPRPSDPTRHITSFKTAWKTMRKNAKVKGRWHDNRHTLITELAESGAGDETIMQIAAHVDRQMFRHYSHIRIKAKREALEAVTSFNAGHRHLRRHALSRDRQPSAVDLRSEPAVRTHARLARQGLDSHPRSTRTVPSRSSITKDAL